MRNLPLPLTFCGCPPVTAEDCCSGLAAVPGAHCPLRANQNSSLAGKRNPVAWGWEWRGHLRKDSHSPAHHRATLSVHILPHHAHLRKRTFSSEEVNGRTETQWRSGRPADGRSGLLPREPTAELAQALLSVKGPGPNSRTSS